MKTGTIVIVLFPYTDLVSFKAHPAVVAQTDDSYKDIIVCMMTSVVSQPLSSQQLLIYPTPSNQLKTTSIIKVSEIVTVEKEKIAATIGELDAEGLLLFKEKLKSLVDSKN